MKIRSAVPQAVLALSLALAGCGDRPSRPGAATPAAGEATAPAATPEPGGWLGQWNGPEGTFLRLTRENGAYKVTIQNLDGPRTFPGTAAGERIQFERDGVLETLHATNGLETGMKWLAEKSDCLTVRPGEGYCRP